MSRPCSCWTEFDLPRPIHSTCCPPVLKTQTDARDLAYLARPYKTDGWNLVHGIFRMPYSFRVFFEIDRAPDNVDYIIDHASFTKMDCDPSELLLNGDLEADSNTKYYDTWGGSTGLDLVTPGFGGTGQALKAFQRQHKDYGPAQIVNTDCIAEGERLLFSARIRFELNGNPSECDPFSWSDPVRCSDIYMHTDKAGTREYNRVGYIVTDDLVDGW